MTHEQQLELETRFLDAVRSQPGITSEELARNMGIPEYGIRAACEIAVGEGMLFVFRGGYFASPELVAYAEQCYQAAKSQEEPFFVTAPKLPDLTPPTEPDLDSWEFFYGLLKEAHGLTREQFVALPKQSQETITDTTEHNEASLWLRSPDSKGYVVTQENYQALGAWLRAHNAPMTQRNLTRAFNALLKTREQIKQEELDKIQKDHDKDKWQN